MHAQQLAQFRFGRILLHAACAFRDHKYGWHWRGIVRELFGGAAVARQPAFAPVKASRRY